MIQLKTLNKRIATRSQGIFYKPVVNEEEKEVDKVYLIRWIDRDGREKLKTVDKHSQGVRIATCIVLRNNTISAVSLGADALSYKGANNKCFDAKSVLLGVA